MDEFFDDYFDRFEDLLKQVDVVLEGLPDEALDWVPGPEMNSIAVITTHALGSTRFWLGDMGLGEDSGRIRQEEFEVSGLLAGELMEKVDALRQYAQASRYKFSVDKLADKRLVEPNVREFSVGWSILHALEHLAVHVGHLQVTRQLWFEKQG